LKKIGPVRDIVILVIMLEWTKKDIVRDFKSKMAISPLVSYKKKCECCGKFYTKGKGSTQRVGVKYCPICRKEKGLMYNQIHKNKTYMR